MPVSGEEIAESRIVEHERTHLNEQEHNLLKELLRPGASIDAIIPPDAEPEELWNTLDSCVRGLGLLEARIIRLTPIIGKILLIFENKPSLYKHLGYETYSDFMKLGVYDKLGLHRTSAYMGKLIARDWPQITPDRYAGNLGPKKMEILSKAKVVGKNSNAEILLQTAESMSVSAFQTYMEQRGFIAKGESVGMDFTIHTNQSRHAMFKEFFNDGRVHSVVGSNQWDVVMESAIQEIYQEWVEKYESDRREKRKKGASA